LLDADAASFSVDGGKGQLKVRTDMDAALRRCPWIAGRRGALLGIIAEVWPIFRIRAEN
jgi:hypothetical protein